MRKQEYQHLAEKDRSFIKGQKYTLLSSKQHLTLEGQVSLGFVEGLNKKIRVMQRKANGLRHEEYRRLKVLTCMLKPI